ncbi:MAG: pyridoxamine kinase [Clostridia bacterium]|nr:pyridoxamine kinase [Clostridia bacterium]MBQ8908647.1 pyridoxamine kinase [Clostridia bacterium]
MKDQKRVLAIHDLCCVGKCSLTTAIPILSAAGMEACALPTAVFSTHTAFPTFTFLDLTDELTRMASAVKEHQFHFDAFYTGYLGTAAQAAIVKDIIALLKSEDSCVIVDPVMADNGSLYKHLTPDFPQEMLLLSAHADVITPNVTEAALMLGKPYMPAPQTEEYVRSLLTELHEKTGASVVLTSICLHEGDIGCACLDRETGAVTYTFQPKEPTSYHGTGDVFASVLCAAYMQSGKLAKSMEVAATFVRDAIQTTEEQPSLWYGIRFEDLLSELQPRIKEIISN